MIVGLTGGIGSGKTTVSDAFAEKNIDIIDADLIARSVVAAGTPALSKIVQHFGSSILRPDGHLDRKKLREKVFNDSNQKSWLDNLLHPLIREEITHRMMQVESPYGICVIPLLYENRHHYTFDRILVVDCDPSVQIERTIKRDNIAEPLAQAMLNSQISRKKRLEIADDIIYNNGSHAELMKQVDVLHETYLSLAQ